MIFARFASKRVVLLYPVPKICVEHNTQMSMDLQLRLWIFAKKLCIPFVTTIKKVKVGGIELKQSLYYVMRMVWQSHQKNLRAKNSLSKLKLNCTAKRIVTQNLASWLAIIVEKNLINLKRINQSF